MKPSQCTPPCQELSKDIKIQQETPWFGIFQLDKTNPTT